MTRNRFLAALAGALGIARAQQDTIPAPRHATAVWPKKNGECPVCGTMAEPFRCDPQYSITQTDVRLSGRDIVLLSAGKSSDKPPKMPSRLVRCARCNAAFWQDAEPAREGGK